MKVELDQYIQFEAVDLSRGHSLSSRPGWDLIATYTDVQMENLSFYDHDGRWVTRSHPVTRTYAMLGHRGNLAEEQMHQINSLRSQVDDLAREKEKTGKEVAEKLNSLQRTVADLDYQAKNAKSERDQSVKQEIEAKRLFRLLESDVAKVKAAIGEIQFNKIVGA